MPKKAKTVKMSDMPIEVALYVFGVLNPGRVMVEQHSMNPARLLVITDTEPSELVYPEGWYYAEGNFRNKHMSSTGFYDEVWMLKGNGERWDSYATYCTLHDD